MIKAIIFDCFGVLTTEGFGAFRTEYLAGSDEKMVQANKAMDELNAGLVSETAFAKTLASLSDVPVEKVEEYLSSNQPNKPLFNFIRKDLKPTYKIGLLSNAGGDWLEELFGKEDVALFDDTVLSYEHQIIKPNPDIYLLAAKRLQLQPDECVFIDDNPGHCSGAQGTGMQTIVYQNFAQMKVDLDKILEQG